MKINSTIKLTTQKLIMFAVCLIMGLSCAREAVDFSTPQVEDKENIGYLEFSNISVTVDSGSEIVSKADDDISEASDDYSVSIYSEKEESVVYTSTYGEIKSGSEPLALTPGVYQINVVSTSDEPLYGWEAPYYSASKSVTIVKQTTTQVSDLVCKLSNIKTSITYSADLGSMFKPDNGTDEDLNVNVSIGESSLDFDRNEERCGYFKAVEESNTMTIVLSGMYNMAAADEDPSYTMIEGWKQVISGVKAGQWRKINIRVESANDGSVTFIIDVETWIYDENIDVDVMSQSFVFDEESIYDPDDETTDAGSPVVTLANGHDIDEPFVIDESIFDFDAETCYDVIKANITPQSGSTVESIDVTLSSDNAAFVMALQSAGFVDGAVEVLPVNTISDYLSVSASGDVVVVTAKYSAMSAIYNFVGEHVAKILVVDSEGRRSFTYLTIKVESSAQEGEGPSIVWRAGYSFDVRHEISATTTLPVVFDITSSTGITSFLITIDSEALPESELTGMSLATTMDLINPATPEMAATLADLGFPVGDEVEGATALIFDITSFMPLLAMMGEGTSDFKLDVSDASGTTTRTLMVNSVSE